VTSRRTKFVNDREEVQSMADAVHLKCLDCSCWSRDGVVDCFDIDCPLYPWRLYGVYSGVSEQALKQLRKTPSPAKSEQNTIKNTE